MTIFFQMPLYSESQIQDPVLERFDRILLLPVLNISRIYGQNVSMPGPLSGKVFITGPVAPDAAEFIAATLYNQITRMWPVRMIDPKWEDIDAMVGIAPVDGPVSERIAAIRNTGRQRGVDGVLCAYIYVFRKRVGTAFAVDTPAMISIELNLISSATGRLVWQQSFTETQKPLNENLLRLDQFLQRKGQWITAEEMATQAIKDMLSKIPEPLRN